MYSNSPTSYKSQFSVSGLVFLKLLLVGFFFFKWKPNTKRKLFSFVVEHVQTLQPLSIFFIFYFYIYIRNKRYIKFEKSAREGWEVLPHIIQRTKQNKTKHLCYTRSTIHIGVHKSSQDRIQNLSMLSTPFELQTESQLSWITLNGIPLKLTVQEASNH